MKTTWNEISMRWNDRKCGVNCEQGKELKLSFGLFQILMKFSNEEALQTL